MTETEGYLIYTHRNDSSSVFSLWLEPWAEEYDVHSGSEIVVRMHGSPTGKPEIDESVGRVAIYAPLGCLVDVLIDGATVNADWASSRIAIPDSSPLETRQMIDMLFGSFPEARPGGAPVPPSGWRKWLSKFRRL